jgi:hypothetical protein
MPRQYSTAAAPLHTTPAHASDESVLALVGELQAMVERTAAVVDALLRERANAADEVQRLRERIAQLTVADAN